MNSVLSSRPMPAVSRQPTPFGVAVKELRLQRGWTQAILANKTGLSITALSNIESGVTTRVSRGTRQAIAKALAVAEEELDPIALGERVATGAVSLEQRRAVLLALSAPPGSLERLFSHPGEEISEALSVLRQLAETERARRRKRRAK